MVFETSKTVESSQCFKQCLHKALTECGMFPMPYVNRVRTLCALARVAFAFIGFVLCVTKNWTKGVQQPPGGEGDVHTRACRSHTSQQRVKKKRKEKHETLRGKTWHPTVHAPNTESIAPLPCTNGWMPGKT